MQREIDTSPTGIYMMQEYDGYPALDPTASSREWNEEFGVMTAIKSSLGTLSLPDDRSVTQDTYRHQGRTIDCCSGILSCLATFERPRAGFQAITLINVHFHRMPAKELHGCKTHYKMFFDNIGALVPPDAPAILAGDFNMACFKVEPAMKARGFHAQPLHLPPQPEVPGTALDDCMAMFVLWRHPEPDTPLPTLPCDVRVVTMDRFDPQRRLLGHGSHHPVTAYFRNVTGPRVRTEEGRQRQKQRARERWQQHKAYQQFKATEATRVVKPTPAKGAHWTTTSKAHSTGSGASSSTGPYLPPTSKGPLAAPPAPPPPVPPPAPAAVALSSSLPPPPPPPPAGAAASARPRAVLTRRDSVPTAAPAWPRPEVRFVPRQGLTLTRVQTPQMPWPAAGSGAFLPPRPTRGTPPVEFAHLPPPPPPPLPPTILYPLPAEQVGRPPSGSSSYYSSSSSSGPSASTSAARTERTGRRTQPRQPDAPVAGSTAKASGTQAVQYVDLEEDEPGSITIDDADV